MLGGLLAGLAMYFLTIAVGDWLINTYYLSEQSVHSRNMATIEDFQSYVTENHLSSRDTDAIARWSISKQDIYILFYKDRHLALEAGWWGVDGTSSLADDELNDLSPFTLYPVSFRDGIFQAVIYDFSESHLGTLTTIVAVALGIGVFALVILLYNRKLTRAIVLVSKEIQEIGRGNLQFQMVAHGSDELSQLVVSVDSMRRSLIRKTQEEQEALEKNSELITAMSHDIRNPLTALMGYLDLAKSGQFQSCNELNQYITASYDKAEQIRHLTDELFRYSLVFGGKPLPLEMERYDALILFEQLLGEQSVALSQTGFAFRTDFQPLTGQIRVDVTYLKRVLDNLFDNLRKYAEPQKPVVLSLFAEENWLHLSIENEIAQKPSGVESNKIGLRTCERIMQQMGGNFLKFQSGTHFTAELMLPLSVPEAESDAQNMPDGESKH